MLASLDFPFNLPGKLLVLRPAKKHANEIAVGDLSRYVPGASDRAKAKEQYGA